MISRCLYQGLVTDESMLIKGKEGTQMLTILIRKGKQRPLSGMKI